MLENTYSLCKRFNYRRQTSGVYLLVKICWSSERACTVADVGLTATDRDAVVLGFFKPVGVLPVRVVVNATAVKLGQTVNENV